MTERSQVILARCLLALLVLVGLAWLWHLDLSRKVSTDVLDLIPAGGRQPELALVRSLASEKQGRVVLLVVEGGQTDPSAREAQVSSASAELARQLLASGEFEEAVVMGGEGMRNDLAKALYERRLDLLLPQWLARKQAALPVFADTGAGPQARAEALAEAAVADLDGFLSRPEAVAFQDLMPSDPLLLMPTLVDGLKGASMPGGGGAGLVWALQKASPLHEEGQGPVFKAIESAIRALPASGAPGAARVRWTGVARFAAESRQQIQAELSWLNTLSLVAVIGVGVLCLSRILPAFNLAPPVLLGLLGAWVVTTACFDRVHVLVFVVGSLLGGVAIDYGFYLYLQPPLYPEEPYRGKLGRLAKPLLSSALTTVLGFSLLLVSDLPLIRQLGVFVSAGLLFALLGAVLWFAQLRRFHLPARRFVAVSLPERPSTRRMAQGVLLLGAAIAVLGPWLLAWRDDIRELEVPTPILRSNDEWVRARFGDSAGTHLYLSRGKGPAEAREAWGRFSSWLESGSPGSGVMSLALVVPREQEWQGLAQETALLQAFPGAFEAALQRHGYESASFKPFFEAYAGWLAQTRVAYPQLVADLASSLHGPTALLMATGREGTWFASLVNPPEGSGALPEPPPALDTVSVSQLSSLNRLFADYRSDALRLSGIGLSLVGLSVFLIYGLRRGLRVFLVPVGSCLFCFGVLGLIGHPLNLFHLLGAFLGVCLSHNYAIFSTENSLRGEGIPPSIRLSALSTALSFGVLALSHIPVVASLGLTVALIVLGALAIVELGVCIGRREKVVSGLNVGPQ